MENKCMMSQNEGIWNDVIFAVFVWEADKCSFCSSRPGQNDETTFWVFEKLIVEGCCETYCMAVAHDRMTDIFLHPVLCAVGRWELKCHMEHFMNIWSLNFLWKRVSHRDDTPCRDAVCSCAWRLQHANTSAVPNTQRLRWKWCSPHSPAVVKTQTLTCKISMIVFVQNFLHTRCTLYIF